MRTTLTLDDRLAKVLKQSARKSGKSLDRVVNETLKAGLAGRRTTRKRTRYRITPVSLGGVKPGIDLDKALALFDRIEGQKTATTLRLPR
ncbi:MAG: hypothetical protein LV473_01225 [Nitrospira sp.]|nr:hypothetical protein [Nitrospira sp.]